MTRRDLVVGTAGHIDHGKTALVRALTGVDTDRLPAEKLRGITIDLGFASLDFGDVQAALVDVPGHERFVRNMLAGATGLDLALLVVAADDSVMPQTREHLEILQLLGLRGGVIALTKCDLADPTWLALVEDDVRALVQNTFLQNAPVVHTSSATGLGIDALRDTLHSLCAAAPVRPDPGWFRMAVDRSFSLAGHGTVVTGTVASGSVAVGDELVCWPEGRSVRVRGLHRHDRAVDRIARGSRAAVNLVGVHHAEIRRGHEIAGPGYLEATRVVAVELRVLDDAPSSLRHRERYRLHLGTAELTATLSLLGPNELKPGETSLAQFLTAEPFVAVWGQPFVVRQESPAVTLGGGSILKPVSGRIRRRDQDAISRLKRLGSDDPSVRATAALAGYGHQSWTNEDLGRDAGLAAADAASLVKELTATGAIVELPVGARRSTRLPAETVALLEDRILRALGRLHDARPRQSFVPRAFLAAQLPDVGNDALIAALIERLAGDGRVLTAPRVVALRGFEPKLSQGERRLKAEVADLIRAGGFSPPDIDDLQATAGPRAAVLPELLTLLREEQRVIEVTPRLYLDFEHEAELRRLVQERLSETAESLMAMADLRDLLKTTRKYAVPIGEYLDRIGLTVRVGDSRRLAPAFLETRAQRP